ncbi:hypothetical protein ABEB36_005073 [Hypothenemus hampei]|uniref:tRNA:m(4)X modification enzyme TRM13 n=1 Tax=Hypothenemus hampei TaxID=57062 RepID=A0ABD1F0S5_HYPHA
MSTTFLHCKYFVKRKKRYCKMLVKSGEEYCGEHQMSSSLTKARIPCPLDPKHTVYTNKLQSHLRICNARVTTVPSYIEKNINVGQMEYSSASDMLSPYQILSTLPKNKVLEVITKINNIYQNNVHISEKFLSFPVVEQELECHSEYGNKTRKHLKQTSAILGYLNECDMLKADTCFIEFGAGRGQLSCWIAEATTQLNNCKILLIERASPKHKRDNKLSKTSDRIQRIRADIADLVLEKLEVFSTVKNVIGITKHLCGSATDLAIRCMVQSTLTKCKSTSLLFTFCCHHKCTWTTYTGKNFFQVTIFS